MEISTEVISISKIRDGIFIGDMRAGINLDLLMQFKISHIINATGMQLPYTFESLGVKYLTIEWSENPPEDTILITNDIVTKIISFIDDSLTNGEGLYGFSFNGKNRICVVIILYLMTKFMWPLKKCYEYIKKKKVDIDINTYYKNQLTEYEKKLFENNNNRIVEPKLFWNLDDLKDKNEVLMRNTYMNEVKNYKINLEENNQKEENKKNIIRHVEWGDNKKYARQMAQPGLIHYNIDKDLFLKKDILDITDHIHKKPLRSCMKNTTNNNINSNTTSTIRRKKKNTKIYLAADATNPTNSSNKNPSPNTNNINISPNEDNPEEIFTYRSNNNNNEKKDIKENSKEKNNKNIKINKNKENKKEKYSYENYTNNDNHLVNNLFITSSKIGENDSDDDEIKLNNIIRIDRKLKENKENKNNNNNNIDNNKNKKADFDHKNLEPQKITNNDIKPILSNLLKIDPNLKTLKKYLKANKKKGIANTFSNFKINITNSNTNSNINSTNENNSSPTINTISNNNDINSNREKINLIPIRMNNNSNSQNKTLKLKNKDDKTNKDIFLLNLNLNIDNRTTFNIKNNFINNGNNQNIGLGKKLNNFFMDSNGNTFFNSFNKFKNRRSNTSEKKDNINNHKYLSPNVNYYLAKQPNQNIRNEVDKKENTFIPNIILNKNSYSINNPRNINQTDKTKIFMRPQINIDRNNINNMINNNKNILKNNVANLNGFNKKESKFILKIYNLLFYSFFSK